jgi:hypothetical protein
MKITELKYTERKNMGNYEHAELSATALVEDGEDINAAVLTLKTYVSYALNGEISKIEVKEVSNGKTNTECNENGTNDGGNSQEAQAEEKSASDKKTKKSIKKGNKVAVVESEPVVEVAPEETPEESAKKTPPKNVVVYNSNIAEHKSIFGGYLAKKYDNAWKTAKPAEEIKAFTSSLNGKHFLDDQGNIFPSFLDLVHGFFGA